MSAMEQPLVETGAGTLRGSRTGDIAGYLGIPYARPPLGSLRWRPPEPAEPWTGVRDATAFPPDPMQRDRPAGSRAPGISEDCLTLNIWAPAGARGPLPVMIWFYGGSFTRGSASDMRVDGALFAREGVVHVAVNSRVGIFGWMAHPEAVAESPEAAAGNYGLLDQIAALRWIRDNIAGFGGDPGRVTLFGVSSGAAAIALLMTSPLAAGLFDRAILESPGSFRPLAGLDMATAAAEPLGPLAQLRALPAEAVMALEKRLVPAMRGLTTPRVLRPIVDGWVVPQDERAAFESGAFHPVPIIVGSVADEGSRLTASWPVDDRAAWREVVRQNFADDPERAEALYPAASDGDARRAVAEMFGDTQFQLGARELARAAVRAGVPAFRYLFTRRRAGAADGPHHGGEVPYVFGHLDMPPHGQSAIPPDPRDRALADGIRRAWIGFAATGDPGAIDGVPWPDAGTAYLELGDETRAGTGWREAQLDFLNDYARR